MTRFPYCSVSFESKLSLDRVGSRISHALFGGLPFSPVYYFDEFPAIELVHDILGLEIIIIQSHIREHRYRLEIKSRLESGSKPDLGELDLAAAFDESVTKEELFPKRFYLDAYVSSLLAELPEMSISQP